MKIRNLPALAVLSIFALVLTGCEDFSGGGWIPALRDPSARATFGFSLHCSNTEGGVAFTGSFEFHDHSVTVPRPNGQQAKLAIHGLLPSAVPGTSCEALDAVFGAGVFLGTYTPQPPNLGPGGSFILQVQDNGKKGPSKEDVINVLLIGGVFDGYSNIGTLGGGQITQHFD